MAVNKNFVVKNGLEVNTNLLVADLDTQTVGIGTTIAPHELHVVGGIGVTNLNVTGVATIANLRIGGISTFVGFTTFLGDVSVGGALTASTVTVQDLTNNRVVIAGTGGELEDSSNFRFDGSQLILGVGATVGGGLTVAGVTDLNSTLDVSGNVSLGSSLDVTGLTELGDVNVSAAMTVAGNVSLGSSLDVTGLTELGDVNVSAASTFGGLVDINAGGQANTFKVEDLTDNRVVLAGTGGELEDSGNLTFDGTQLVVTGVATVSGAMTAGSFSVGNNQVISSARQLQNIASLDSTTTATIESAIANAPNTFTDLQITGIATFKNDVQFHGVAGITSISFDQSSNALNFVDNAKATFGISSDLQIYHDGSHSRIVDSGTGNIVFQSNRVDIQNADGSENIAIFQSDSSVDLYHDNSKKFKTTGYGATVFGTLQSQQLNVTGVSTFTSTVGIAESIFHIGDTNTSFGFPAVDTFTVDTAGSEKLRVSSDGGILVSNDGSDADGANITLKHVNNNTTDVISSLIFSNNVGEAARIQAETAGANNSGLIKFFTDNAGTSTEALRITSDGEKDVKNGPLRITETHIAFTGNSATPTEGAAIFRPAADTLAVSINNAERLRVSSGGDVGIGTTNPERRVEIHDSAATVLQLNSTNANGTSLRIQHNKTDKTFVGLAGDFITGQGSNVTDSAIRASGALLFATGGGTERVRVTGIGSVGIGTVAPEHAFVVRDDGLARIRIRNDSNAADSFASFNLKTRNGEWSMYADGSSGSDDYLKIFRQGSGTHLYFYESIDKIGINSAICQVDANGNTLGDSKFGFLTSETNTGFHVQTNGERTLKVNGDGLISSGIVTASGGFDLGIHSAGTSVVSGPVKILNFVGTGNTFAYNAGTDTIDISIAGGSGGGSGVTETDTTVSTTNPTGVGSFATASFRSASVIAQINQLNTDFQVGRYLMIHDGTTVTVVEESAVSTGSTMLGSFTGVIDGSNVELRVTLASAGVSTVTTKIDTVTV